MKIAIIQNYLDPYVIGGAEICVEKIALGLARGGNQVVVITTGERSGESAHPDCRDLRIRRIADFNIFYKYPIHGKRNIFSKVIWSLVNLWNPFVYHKVKAILKDEKPDIIEVNNFYSMSPSVFSAARSCSAAVIYVAHDFFSICRSSILKKKDRICESRCAGCIAAGAWNRIFMKGVRFRFLSAFAESYFKSLGCDQSVGVYHNPVMVPEREIRENIKLRSGRTDTQRPLRLIFLGRLSRNKGVMTFLQVFRAVARDNIVLSIGGDGELRSEVEDIVRQDDRVKYLGFIKEDAKKRLLLDSDVLMMPSEWYEMSPLVIQEAYAFGLPVVGPDLGSVPEHIKEGETGWLYKYKDPGSLRAVIERLADDPGAVRASSNKCFEVALSNGIDAYVSKLTALYAGMSKAHEVG